MADIRYEEFQYEDTSIEAVAVNDTEWLQVNRHGDESLTALWSTQKRLGETLASLECIVGAPVSDDLARVTYSQELGLTRGGLSYELPVGDVTGERQAPLEDALLATLPVEYGRLTWKRPFKRFTTARYETGEIAFSDVRSIGRAGLEAAVLGTAPYHLSQSLHEVMERLRNLDDLTE